MLTLPGRNLGNFSPLMPPLTAHEPDVKLGATEQNAALGETVLGEFALGVPGELARSTIWSNGLRLPQRCLAAPSASIYPTLRISECSRIATEVVVVAVALVIEVFDGLVRLSMRPDAPIGAHGELGLCGVAVNVRGVRKVAIMSTRIVAYVQHARTNRAELCPNFGEFIFS
jgi:hypothetical protein